jgi:hemerythrin-like domain-containing protein
MHDALTPRLIRREHEALRAVLLAMTRLLRDAWRRGRPPDFHALRAMLFYIGEFPERLHHVKESAMLFPRLRERVPEASALLDRLNQDHGSGEHRVRELEHLLTAWEMLGESRRAAFCSQLEHHERFYLEHMRLEEEELMPLAERHLLAEDWRILDRAFGARRDPLAHGRPEAPYEGLLETLRPWLPQEAADRAA